MTRICNFFKYNVEQIEKMYQSEAVSTKELLQWSKLLEYDFFRLFTQHLILYYPRNAPKKTKKSTLSLPNFRKNIYTKEIVDYILELINSGEMTKQQITDQYKIPKSTLHRWIEKYK
ncbi:helix-turn-helix domain-containing protein [Chryseobacterium sp. Tr-659]|uniref:helix-turn-helix domain-containing protein n=1 Tax=Chryseobacterium sp. Tr-659 TaxID=2608340 RepID=UPI00293BF391|nr:helix-turn-helix domain-containing protein [Chryseobacterium sp. Tr-659]